MSPTIATKSQLLTPSKLSGYHPSVVHTAGMPMVGMFFNQQYLPRMRQDPRCRLGLATIKAPVAVVQITVESEDDRVKVWVDRQLKRLWRQELSRLLLMIDYGRSGGEAQWKLDRDTDLIELAGIKHVHPFDLQPMELDGQFWGIRVKGCGDIPVGQSFHLVNDAEYNPYYGRSRLWGAWEPWIEKTGGASGMGRHGAKDIRRLWFLKNSFSGGTIRHPLGNIDLGDGVTRSAQDYARELLEKMETGGILVLPNTKDEQGNYLWFYEPPKNNGDISGIREFVGDVDTEILEGMEIPPEVLEAQTTGSWAGRTVPFLIFLTKEDSVADNVVTVMDRQLLRPGAEANFGGRVKYVISIKSLIPPEQQQPGGGMGGGIGGAEPPAPPGGGGGGGGMQPYQGPRGGHGMKDPNTGRVHYGQQMGMERTWSEPEVLRLGDGSEQTGQQQADPWDTYIGTRGGKGWKHRQTGRIVYGQTHPGMRRQRGKPAQTPEQSKETGDRAHGFHVGSKALHHDAVVGEVARIAQHMKIWEVHDLASRMGLEAGPKESKSAMLAKIEGHLRTKATSHAPEAAGKSALASADPRVGVVPTADLHVDPKRFQYKLGVSATSGAGEELKGVKSFNPELGGVLAVWKDPEDGKTYVVNGHHRHELASRLGHPDMLVRYLDAKDAKEARSKGALINIAEGRGTAVDAAKFMRDSGTSPEELAQSGVSLTGKVAADSAVLGRLNDKLFDRVARGVLDEQKAIAVAKHLPDHEMQNTLVRLLDKRENEGKDISPRVIEEMAREMAATPTTKKGGDDMFGSYESEESLFVERAEVKAHVRGELAREVNDFLAISSKRHAERVGGAGNVIDAEQNRKIADEANRVKNTFDTLVNRKGGISDEINKAAAEYAKEKSKKGRDEIRKRATDAVKKAVFEEAGVGSELGGSQAATPETAAEAEQVAKVEAKTAPEESAAVPEQPTGQQAAPELPATETAPAGAPEPSAAPAGESATPPESAAEPPVADTPEDKATVKAFKDKPGVKLVRAPAGGQVSEVNGKRYDGGQLMPIHGLSPKTEKKGTGEGTASTSTPNENAKEKKPREPRQPLSPEDIEDERQRREDQSKWDEMRGGVLGQFKWMGDHPNRKGREGRISLDKWQTFASGIGEDKLKKIVDTLRAERHDRIDAEGHEKEGADYFKDAPEREAEADAGMFKRGKYASKHPSSFLARHYVEDAMGETKDVASLHALEKKLSAIVKGEEPPPAAETAATEASTEAAPSPSGESPSPSRILLDNHSAYTLQGDKWVSEKDPSIVASAAAVERWRKAGRVKDHPETNATEKTSPPTSKPPATADTNAPEFKAWFGDHESDPANASKVVTPDGEPQDTHLMAQAHGKDGKRVTVFHGSPEEFDKFDKSKVNGERLSFGPGFYFTENEGVADAYRTGGVKGKSGGKVHAAYLAIKKPFDGDKDTVSLDNLPAEHQAKAKEYLAKKAKDERSGAASWRARAEKSEPGSHAHQEAISIVARKEKAAEAFERGGLTYHQMSQVMGSNKAASEALKSAGYDGVTHMDKEDAGTGSGEHRIWIAFEPEQILKKDHPEPIQLGRSRKQPAQAGFFDAPQASEPEWIHDPGPRSQNRWRSLRTGRLVYRQEMPGSHEHEGEHEEEPGAGPPASAGHSDSRAALASIPIGDLARVSGVMVRRTGPNDYRVETDAGQFQTAGQTADERQAGVVRGDAAKIAAHIASVASGDAMYGRQRDEALARVAGYDEPSFMDTEGMEAARRGFNRLPIGAKVVSLEEGTNGRIGEIVTDPNGARRVKFEGEDGYGSPYIEPLDARQSWRKPYTAGGGPKQGGMFDTDESDAGGENSPPEPVSAKPPAAAQPGETAGVSAGAGGEGKQPHEMTATEALKAGVDFHKWHNSVVDAFRNEVTAENDPIYHNLSKIAPDDYERAQRLMGKQVEANGRIVTLTDVAPDFSHVVVTHPDGGTSIHSMSGLRSLTDLIDHAVSDAKDGSLHPSRAAKIAPYLAKEILDENGNLFAKLKEKGVDPMSRGGRVLRDAVAASIDQLTAEKNKPSPERQKAMDRQKELQAAEDAEKVTSPPPVKTSFTSVSHAAQELQDIRNDLASAEPSPDLQARVDAIGEWLAKNAKPTGLGAKLLVEASQIADRLKGGSGKGGTRIEIQEPETPDAVYSGTPPAPSIESTATPAEESFNAEESVSTPGRTAAADLGGNPDGSAGGNDGGRGSRSDVAPRIITVRPEHTRQGNPALVPEALRPHLNETQQQGVALAIEAMEKSGGFLNADGTGTGKSRQQLAVAQHFASKGKKVVIVSPAEVIKPNWAKGTTAGSFANDGKAMGVNAKLIKGDGALTPGSVHITTYNELGKLKDQVDKDTIVIYDESHSLKNPSSARSKHGKEASSKAGAVMYATATPGDKPLHIAHLARANVFGDAGTKGTYEKLGMKLVDQHIGGGQTVKCWQIDPQVGYKEAARRLSGLFDQMTKDGLMIKREMSMDRVDVRMDRVKLSDEEHSSIKKVFADKMNETRSATMPNGNKAVSLMAARLHQEPFKIPATVDMVKEELAAGRMPVIFLGRVNDITDDEDDDEDATVISAGTAKALKAALIAAGVPEKDIGELHGGATKTPEQKRKAMENFQSGKTKIMIATIASGGTGINLDDTTGNSPRSLIMMTPPFTANDMSQALGRVNRLNTKSDVRVRGVLADTSIDDWNAKLLERKFQTLGAVVGGTATRGLEAIGGTADLEEDEAPFEWGESLHPRPKILHNTPFSHNDLIAKFGGKRVKNGPGQNDWTTQFPSQEALDKYKEHVAPKVSTSTPSVVGQPSAASKPAASVPISVSGNTFAHKDKIKAAGGRWNGAKGVWEVTPEAKAKLESLSGLRFSGGPAPAEPEPYISERQRAAIHQSLKQLAAADSDRARQQNGEGYNKMDSEFGASLADAPKLTDRQALAGMKMIDKYKRQLGDDLHRQATTHDERPN